MAFLDFKTPRRRSLLFDASDQTKHLEGRICYFVFDLRGKDRSSGCWVVHRFATRRQKSAAAKSVAAKRPSVGQNPWQGLWRQAGWGLAAATALGIAVLGSRDDDAPQKVRGPVFIATLAGTGRRADFDAETAARQLAQAVRSLADDRDKLATRLNALDHEMRDMSGAIKQQIEAAKSEAIKTAKQAPPWPESAPPVPMTLADVAVMVKTVSPAPAGAAEPPSPSVATSATNTDEHASPDTTASLGQAYGADLGTASTMKTLHHRWASLRAAHPQLFEGIQPVVSVKQNPRTGRTELHLVVGPYANAETAAQFCDFVVPYHVSRNPIQLNRIAV